jgi:hypothetical protein
VKPWKLALWASDRQYRPVSTACVDRRYSLHQAIQPVSTGDTGDRKGSICRQQSVRQQSVQRQCRQAAAMTGSRTNAQIPPLFILLSLPTTKGGGNQQQNATEALMRKSSVETRRFLRSLGHRNSLAFSAGWLPCPAASGGRLRSACTTASRQRGATRNVRGLYPVGLHFRKTEETALDFLRTQWNDHDHHEQQECLIQIRSKIRKHSVEFRSC